MPINNAMPIVSGVQCNDNDLRRWSYIDSFTQQCYQWIGESKIHENRCAPLHRKLLSILCRFFGVGVGGWQLHILALPYQMVGAPSPTENSGSAPINFWYVSCVLLVQWLITEQVLLSLKSLERREAKVLNRDQRTIISLNHAMVFCGCLCCYTCLTMYSFATK